MGFETVLIPALNTTSLKGLKPFGNHSKSVARKKASALTQQNTSQTSQHYVDVDATPVFDEFYDEEKWPSSSPWHLYEKVMRLKKGHYCYVDTYA